MTAINELLKRSKKLREAAKPIELTVADGNIIGPILNLSEGCTGHDIECVYSEDAAFIVHACNTQETYEKIIEVLAEALTCILQKNPNAVNVNEAADMAVEFHMKAHIAISEVQKISKEALK